MKEGNQKKTAVLIVAAVTSFLTAFIGSSINVALPTIEKEFHISALQLTWVSTSYLLTTAVLLLPFGRLADIFGRKRFFQIGLAIYTLFSLLSGFSFNVESLILFRILQGVGSAMVFVTSNAIITSVFPPGERGRAMGIAVTGVYLGLSMGPFVGGILTEYLGWRFIFYLNVPFGIIMFYLIFSKLKEEWAEAAGESFDLFGSILYALSLISLLIGFTSIKNSLGQLSILLSIILFALFVLWEKKQIHPIFNFSLFLKNKQFAFSNLAALINYSSTFAVSFMLSLYLQTLKGLTAKEAGFLLAIQPVTQALLSSYAGKLSDKTQPRYIASFGMGLTTAGLILLSFLGQSTPTYFIVSSLIVIGLGFAFFTSPNTNAIMSSVEKKYLGIASASVSTMRLVGMLFSIGFVTIFFSIFYGNQSISSSTETLLTVHRIIFTIFSISCGLGIIASMARGNSEIH